MIAENALTALMQQLTLHEKVALLSGRDAWGTTPIPRLGIPSIVFTDGPHGVRADGPRRDCPSGFTTAFPTGVALAATWNPELIERVGQALGAETRAMGCHVLLGPCVNIVRHPLAGRNFESYSEDPYLAGRIGVAFVRGVQSQGVGVSLKHYAANNQEFGRQRISSEVDERTLREIYLAQFETIVREAQPWTVMCAYNRINGDYASEHHHLLTEILKDEWGFQGAVISDWGANHSITASVKGGLDLEMPGPAKYYGALLVEAVSNWQIGEACLDEAARRMLRIILTASQTEGPGSANTPEHQALAQAAAEDALILLKNERGLLPLRPETLHSVAIIGPNADKILISGGGSAYVSPPYVTSPLAALRTALDEHIAIHYAPGCDNYVEPPLIKPEWLQTPEGEPGLRGEYFPTADLAGAPTLRQTDTRLDFWWFREGPLNSPDFSVRWTGQLIAPGSGRHTLQLKHTATARVYLNGALLFESQAEAQTVYQPRTTAAVMEMTEGETHDLRLEFAKANDDSFASFGLYFAFTPLAEHDQRLDMAVATAAQADVVLLFVGMPTDFEAEGRDRPALDLPGPQAELIRAVAAANANTIVVLNAGAPVSMPWLEKVPALLYALYPGMEAGHAIANVLTGVVNPSGRLPVTFPKRLEDTPAFLHYPGQREVVYGEGLFVGYRHYDSRAIEPLFPFGYGLSYTEFEYGPLQLQTAAEPHIELSLTVKNCGSLAGQEVIQAYVCDRQASLIRPTQELKGFAKIALQPGEAKSVSFKFDRRAFSFYDPHVGQWVMEPGEFEIRIGASSRNIRSQITLRWNSDATWSLVK